MRYFDPSRPAVRWAKIAQGVQDPQGMPLVKQGLKAGGRPGVPPGGPFRPLAAHLYLNEGDGAFEAMRRKTPEGPDEAVNYPRFADDRVIPVRGHPTKRGGAERALPRLQAQLAPWGVALNREKTRGVNTRAGEAFGRRGVDRRRGRRGTGPGDGIRMTAKKKARQAMKAKVRDIVRPGGAPPAEAIVARIKGAWAEGVHYLRGGKARRAFREVRDYIEMKVRTLLRRRPRRRKRRVGWRRWSNEYLYEVRGLYGDWKVHPLPRAQAFP